MNRRCWTEINLSILQSNAEIYKRYIADMQIMAVVKADAYGHGDKVVAKMLSDYGQMNLHRRFP